VTPAVTMGSFTRHLLLGKQGQVLSLLVGDQFSVTLDESPTTGFRWNITKNDPALLALIDQSYTPDPPGSVGGGGKVRFTFATKSEGNTPLDLAYFKSWEGPGAAINSFHLDISIQSS
jgi:inhibitor of cysteine peptidase